MTAMLRSWSRPFVGGPPGAVLALDRTVARLGGSLMSTQGFIDLHEPMVWTR